MATNGILLGQNNNEESLKKEVFFISDPITLNMNPADSHSESSFSTLTLPTEEMKKYSYVNFGIYDGNCSTKITGYRSGQSYMYIFFRLNSRDFYIYSRNIGSGAVNPEKYEDSFTFSKNNYLTCFINGADHPGSSYRISPIDEKKIYALSSYSNCDFYTTVRTVYSDEYINLTLRFYLEGIK